MPKLVKDARNSNSTLSRGSDHKRMANEKEKDKLSANEKQMRSSYH